MSDIAAHNIFDAAVTSEINAKGLDNACSTYYHLHGNPGQYIIAQWLWACSSGAKFDVIVKRFQVDINACFQSVREKQAVFYTLVQLERYDAVKHFLNRYHLSIDWAARDSVSALRELCRVASVENAWTWQAAALLKWIFVYTDAPLQCYDLRVRYCWAVQHGMAMRFDKRVMETFLLADRPVTNECRTSATRNFFARKCLFERHLVQVIKDFVFKI